jgi:hypothetical protein
MNLDAQERDALKRHRADQIVGFIKLVLGVAAFYAVMSGLGHMLHNIEHEDVCTYSTTVCTDNAKDPPPPDDGDNSPQD